MIKCVGLESESIGKITRPDALIPVSQRTFDMTCKSGCIYPLACCPKISKSTYYTTLQICRARTLCQSAWRELHTLVEIWAYLISGSGNAF